MNSIEVSLYFDEPKYAALKTALEEDGSSIDAELKLHFQNLYEKYISPEQRLFIDAHIEQVRERERIEAEARKRFAVYHVHENGIDSYFTNQYFKSFASAAYRYRMFSRGELDSMPQSFADALAGSETISDTQFNFIQSGMSSDPRILAVMDFDLDNGVVSIMKPEMEEPRSYSLHDVSVAAYKAFRSDYYSSEKRAEILADSLYGKELNVFAQEADPSIQM